MAQQSTIITRAFGAFPNAVLVNQDGAKKVVNVRTIPAVNEPSAVAPKLTVMIIT